MKTAFNQPGNFYKGNVHGHSTYTDGKYTIEQVAELYRDKGWDFISITDHLMPEHRYKKGLKGWTPAITDTSSIHSSDFSTIIGAEIHAPSLSNGDIWHIVALGLPLDFGPITDDETGLDLIKRAHATGAYIGIPHPSWYTLTVTETLPMLPYTHAIEVWNTAAGYGGRADAWPFTDELLTAGHRLHTYAADDSHRFDYIGNHTDAWGGWIQVKSESLDPDALLEAIKAGHYYSSTGPEFEEISFDGEKLTVRSSPVDRYYVSGKGACMMYASGENLTEAEFKIETTGSYGLSWGGYLRVTAIDTDGREAWSQPIWLSDFE